MMHLKRGVRVNYHIEMNESIEVELMKCILRTGAYNDEAIVGDKLVSIILVFVGKTRVHTIYYILMNNNGLCLGEGFNNRVKLTYTYTNSR